MFGLQGLHAPLFVTLYCVAGCLSLAHYWQLGAIAAFVAYYAFALRQYGRWLRDNYADLDHMEVWQSLLLALALFVVYELYTSNMGQASRVKINSSAP